MQRAQPNRGIEERAASRHASDEADFAAGSHGWERASVTYRLTEERRRALLALTPDLGLRDSPTAAIDLAIERAAGMGAAALCVEVDRAADGRDDMMGELRAVLEACAALRSESDRTRASLARLENRLADLGGGGRMPGSKDAVDGTVAATPLALGAWLDREVGPSLAWAVVKARWLDARPANAGKAMLRLDAWAAAPPEFASQTASVETVQAGPARFGALTAFERGSVGVLVCSRTAQGWIAKVHALDARGKLGPELDSFVA